MKKILIALAILAVIVLAFTALSPDHCYVERSATIHAKPHVVYNQIAELKNWMNWMPWNRVDPNMKITWGATTQGQGGSYSWESSNSNVGNGSITISHSSQDSIITEMNFMDNGLAKGMYYFKPEGENTKVTWAMYSELGFNPLERAFGYFMESMIAPDFEKGLKSLDSVSKVFSLSQLQKMDSLKRDTIAVQ